MVEIRIIKNLTEEIIQEVIDRIVKAVNPEKIVLFGSYAYGQPKKSSDLDILVIMNSDLPGHKRSIPIYDALHGLIFPSDIVVYTPEEVKEWENVPLAFITSVLKKGRVLYEKQS